MKSVDKVLEGLEESERIALRAIEARVVAAERALAERENKGRSHSVVKERAKSVVKERSKSVAKKPDEVVQAQTTTTGAVAGTKVETKGSKQATKPKAKKKESAIAKKESALVARKSPLKSLLNLLACFVPRVRRKKTQA